MFSPRIGLNGGLEGLELGVSPPTFRPLDGGVSDRVGLLSGERLPISKSGVLVNLSGDLSGDRLSELRASV